MLDARVSDLREVARSVIAFIGDVSWWKDRLWINGQLHTDKDAKLILATALERTGVKFVSTQHINTVFLHIKSITATERIPKDLAHVAEVFPADPMRFVYARPVYNQYCKEKGITPISSWVEVLYRLFPSLKYSDIWWD